MPTRAKRSETKSEKAFTTSSLSAASMWRLGGMLLLFGWQSLSRVRYFPRFRPFRFALTPSSCRNNPNPSSTMLLIYTIAALAVDSSSRRDMKALSTYRTLYFFSFRRVTMHVCVARCAELKIFEFCHPLRKTCAVYDTLLVQGPDARARKLFGVSTHVGS